MNLLYPVQLEVALALLGLGTLVAEAVRPFRRLHRLGCMLALAVLALFALSFLITPADAAFFNGSYRLDAFSLFFKRLFLLITALVLVVAAEFSPRLEHGVTEHYVLILMAAVGMLVLGSAADFILLFVALELVTISFMVMTSHHRRQIGSLEAGTKYLVMGGLASGLLVYGISYIFGTTGHTGFAEVAQAIQAQAEGARTALSLGILLVLLGLGFKIAAVPGQLWAPDVYQGAPLPATAFLATGSKIAGFALLLRLLFEGLLPAASLWAPMTVYVAGLTLLYGNLGALGQKDVKRLLGYSSIAHTGYLLMGVVAMNALGLAASLFYLAQYAISSLAGFLAMAAVARAGGGSDLASFTGLHRRSPLLAAGLALSMLSLAGVPPLSGFFGKFLLFSAVLDHHLTNAPLLVLAMVAAIGVVISFFFYFGVVRAVYVDEPDDPRPIPVSAPVRLSLIACLALIVVLGVFQEPLVAASKHAVEQLSATLQP
jgi:NADH-quinone oxidoreductase subunit N